MGHIDIASAATNNIEGKCNAEGGKCANVANNTFDGRTYCRLHLAVHILGLIGKMDAGNKKGWEGSSIKMNDDFYIMLKTKAQREKAAG